MSFGGPTKYCPRCNTLLPAQAPVCGTCGMQFSDWAGSQSASGYGTAQYGGQGAPGGWPQSQPTYQPPGYPPYQPPSQPWQSAQPGYDPQSQPGLAGYAPVAAPPGPRKISNGMILIGLAVAAAIIAVVIFVNINHSASGLDRHGQQSNVPLPDNSAFVSMKTVSTNSGGISFTYDEWIWTVSNSEPANVQQFYENQLPGTGWTNVRPMNGGSGTLDVTACQGNQLLIIGVSQHLQDSNAQGTPTPPVDAPQGGSALGVILSSDQQLLQDFCL